MEDGNSIAIHCLMVSKVQKQEQKQQEKKVAQSLSLPLSLSYIFRWVKRVTINRWLTKQCIPAFEWPSPQTEELPSDAA